MTKAEKARRDEWRDKLRNMLKPGDTVYTVLRHVSRSGMSRRIDLYTISDGAPVFITGMAAAAMGMRWDNDKGGIIVGGCGMDMGFHLVYNLSATLFPDGHGCIGERCPSNDHSNGDRDYAPHNDYEGSADKAPEDSRPHWHRDGGYALRHRWM